jgi:DNA recombination protein RmuC
MSAAVLPWLLVVLAGAAASGIVVGLLSRREAARLRGDLADQRQINEATDGRLRERENELAAMAEKASRIDTLESLLREREEQLANLRADAARRQSEIEAREREHERQIADLTALREKIQQELKILTGDALKESRNEFMKLAKQEFENDHARRHEAVKGLVEPIEKGLKAYHENLTEIEKKRLAENSSLHAVLEQMSRTQTEVRNETSRLVNALRASPQTRGRWGEETLRNVMELAGMTQYVDFELQESVSVADGRLRPDAVIRMPGGGRIVIDAKTALTGYLDALEAVDDEERERHLKSHARQMRQHVDALASKEYQSALKESPEFVAMFVPGDNFFAAATERDPDLYQHAINKRILIVTPTTLIALAKAISFGWRQENVAENARHISELGRDLYQRLTTLGGHVASMGRSLESSVKHYNSFVGSLEASVLPQARKFREMEVETGNKRIDEPPLIETDIREARRDRDLSFDAGEAGEEEAIASVRPAALPGE